MIRANEEITRAISSLKGNHSFYKIVELLKDEQMFCITGLMTAKVDTFQQLQGRTKLLEEILSILQDN